MKSSKIITLSSLVLLTFLAVGCGGRRNGTQTKSTFRVQSVNLLKVTSMKQNPNHLNINTQLYNLSACVSDEVFGSAISRTEFAVTDGKGALNLTTDDSGCLYWSETHSVDDYESKTLFEIERTFQGHGSYSGEQTVVLIFNPWSQDGDSISDARKVTPFQTPRKLDRFGFNDSIGLSKDKNETTESSEIDNSASSIDVTDLSLEFLNLDFDNYRIDKALNLSVAQRFRVQMSPTIKSKTLDGKWRLTPITEGRLSLRVFLLKSVIGESPKGSDVISVANSELRVRPNGTASGIISISASDISLIASRMQVLVEVKSHDLGETVAPGYAIGQINALKGNNASADLEVASPNLVNQVIRLGSQKTVSDFNPLNDFLKTTKFQTLPMEAMGKNLSRKYAKNPYDFRAKAQEYLEGKLKDKSDLFTFYRALCFKIFANETDSHPKAGTYNFVDEILPPSSPLQDCLGSPEDAFDITVNDFVTEILDPVPRHEEGSTREFTMEFSSVLEFGKSDEIETGTESGTKVTAEVRAGFSAHLPEELGIHGGLGIQIQKEKSVYRLTRSSNSKANKAEAKLSVDQSVRAISNSFEIDVQFRRCLMVASKAESKSNGYFCESGVRNRKTTETYYFVNQSLEASPFTDPDSAASTKWRMVVRGNKEFSELRGLVSREGVVLHFEKSKGSEISPSMMMTQSYPGLLSTTE